MLLDRIMETLRGAMPELEAEFGVSSLAVFGSVARGDERPDSDVDVLVEFRPGAKVTLLTLAGVRLFLCDLLGREVDVVEPGGLRPRIRDTVLSEARHVA